MAKAPPRARLSGFGAPARTPEAPAPQADAPAPATRKRASTAAPQHSDTAAPADAAPIRGRDAVMLMTIRGTREEHLRIKRLCLDLDNCKVQELGLMGLNMIFLAKGLPPVAPELLDRFPDLAEAVKAR